MVSNIVCAMVWLAFGQVQVSPTSTPPFAAELQSIVGDVLNLSVDGQVRSVPLNDMRTLKFPFSPVGASPLSISLRDGTQLAAESMISDGSSATIRLAGGFEFQADTAFVGDVQLGQLTPSQLKQWQAICQSRIEADMLVLIRSPDSLDKIEGLIQSMNAEAVDFEFSGQSVPAPLTKLAGLRFFAATEPKTAKVQAVVLDRHGGRWNAAQLRYQAEGPLSLTLSVGLQLDLPLQEVAEIDFSVGSMKYLAELESIERSAASRFELGVDIPGAGQLFGARPVAGKRLPPSIEFLGSGTSTYRVPADFTRLLGTVELAPRGNKLTACVVQVLLEKKVVWEKRLSEPEDAQPLDITVVGDQRLQLVVQAESKIPVGDVVLFREVRFLK